MKKEVYNQAGRLLFIVDRIIEMVEKIADAGII